ncbi:MAG: sensor histidine kinase [Bacteroidia bacterium]
MKKSKQIRLKFTDKHDVSVRHLCIIVFALFFGTLTTKNNNQQLFGYDWLINIAYNFFFIATIWNGNILLIDLTDRFIKWKNIKQKITVFLIIALVWPTLVYYSFNIFIYPVFYGQACQLNSRENTTFLIISITITLLINSIFTAIEFFKFWRQTLTEKEQLKRESLSAEFETLKSQINPHFLFNALNTLTNLIEENPQTATEFVQKLSSVYRYVLNQKDKETATLKEELAFIESYIFLNQMRFGNNLQVQYMIDKSVEDKRIITLSLQMLVENAIKHNIISNQHPLIIHIGSTQNEVYISNNLQPKATAPESNGIGLSNIISRYGFLTDRQVNITNNNKIFKVEIPLLD